MSATPGNGSEGSFEFGPYRLSLASRLVTRHGESVPLSPKAFDLLAFLVRGPGRAFSKQELMAELWPDTVVEEANLSFQVATLRRALGADGARWIETVPRHGYRFSAVVTVEPSGPMTGPGAAALTGPPRAAARAAAPGPSRARWLWVGAVAALVLIAAFVRLARAPREEVRRGARPADAVPRPLTAYPGYETSPSLSPDGSQVAFAWNGEKQDDSDIYVKVLGSDEPIRLTRDPAWDDKPTWSPDGRRVAFLRMRTEVDGDVFVVPALGGVERRIASVRMRGWSSRTRTLGNLAWTPDGRWLAVGGELGPEPEGIWLLETDGPRRVRLTTAPSQSFGARGDVGPAFSRDGRMLSFVRELAPSMSAAYVVRLSEEWTAAEPRRVAGNLRSGVLGVAWSADGRSLVYSWGGHLGLSRLYRVAVNADGEAAGEPELLPFGEQATTISIGPGQLVYSVQYRDSALATIDLDRPADGPGRVRVAPSTFDEHTPNYSPDGRWLAFASTRTGTEEIWMAEADGSSPRQLTSVGGPTCAKPRWSRDGRTILFSSRREGSSDLYMLTVATGEIVRITREPTEEFEPQWSRDGRFIYFGSNRADGFQVWRMPASGGEPVRVTFGGGAAGIESPDGKLLYYAKSPASPTSLWRVPVAGGPETLVAEGLSHTLNFVVGQRGVYFLAGGRPPAPSSIELVDHAELRRTTVVSLGREPWWLGMALTADGRRLTYATIDAAGANLMWLDGFE